MLMTIPPEWIGSWEVPFESDRADCLSFCLFGVEVEVVVVTFLVGRQA